MTSQGYDDDATLPAVPPLCLPPRSAYAAPSSQRGKRVKRPKSGLTCCSIRPFAPLHVCTNDLTADIFYALVLGVEILVRGWHAQDAPAAAAVPAAAVASQALRPLWSGAAMQPAAALGLCLGAAYSARWLDGSAHWFWIPLTVGLVMKPDFGSIYDRALQRIIGTVVGVTIGALILVMVPKGYLFVLIMALLAAVLPWAMQRSYILQAVFLTPLILMLVDVIVPGTGSVDDALQRLLDTVIGGLIVILLGYVPWRYAGRTLRGRS